MQPATVTQLLRSLKEMAARKTASGCSPAGFSCRGGCSSISGAVRSLFHIACCCAPLTLAGCPDPTWEASEAARAPDHVVAGAIGDLGHGSNTVLESSAVHDIQPPQALRPCCAFGVDLEVSVGAVPVPGIELANIIGPGDVGPHTYDSGFVTINASDSRGGIVDDEANGLLYTCRGGFIDLAHIRDVADLTLALASQIGRTMDTGGAIDLPEQGARIRVLLEPVDPTRLEHYGRRRLVVAAAQWLAFQMSIWHEIATWYGYASLVAWPEKISAFSPEDLYSNLLGAKMSAGIILNGGATSDYEYNRNMDAWVQAVLRRLEVQPKAASEDAMRSVDGVWWDSERRVPDWKLVTRRNMEIDSEIAPWLVTVATRTEGRRGAPFRGCAGEIAPLVLRSPEGFEGIRFVRYASIEYEVDDALAENGFPFPREGSRVVTQVDFPLLVEAIRRENAAAFGGQADRP